MNNFSKLTAFFLFFALSTNFASYSMEQEDHDDFVSWQNISNESETTKGFTNALAEQHSPSQISLLDQCYTFLCKQKKRDLIKLLKKFYKKHENGLPKELLDGIITQLINTKKIGYINTIYASAPTCFYPFLALKIVDGNTKAFNNSEKRQALAILKNTKKIDRRVKKILASLIKFCPELTGYSTYFPTKSSWSLIEIKQEILSSCENEDVINFFLNENIGISRDTIYNFLYDKCGKITSEEQADFALTRLKLLLSYGCTCLDQPACNDGDQTSLELALKNYIDQVEKMRAFQIINRANSLPTLPSSRNLLILSFRLKVIRIFVKNAIKLSINFKDVHPSLEIENQDSLSIDELVEILIEKTQMFELEEKKKAEKMKINLKRGPIFKSAINN